MSKFCNDFKPRRLIAKNGDQDLKMSGFVIHSAFMMCLLVILTGPGYALFWRPSLPTYPSDPQDPFYQGKIFHVLVSTTISYQIVLTWLQELKNLAQWFARVNGNNIISLVINWILYLDLVSIQFFSEAYHGFSISFLTVFEFPSSDRYDIDMRNWKSMATINRKSWKSVKHEFFTNQMIYEKLMTIP